MKKECCGQRAILSSKYVGIFGTGLDRTDEEESSVFWILDNDVDLSDCGNTVMTGCIRPHIPPGPGMRRAFGRPASVIGRLAVSSWTFRANSDSDSITDSVVSS